MYLQIPVGDPVFNQGPAFHQENTVIPLCAHNVIISWDPPNVFWDDSEGFCYQNCTLLGVSLRARHWAKWPAVRTIIFCPTGLTIWQKVFQTKKFSSKTIMKIKLHATCIWNFLSIPVTLKQTYAYLIWEKFFNITFHALFTLVLVHTREINKSI